MLKKILIAIAALSTSAAVAAPKGVELRDGGAVLHFTGKITRANAHMPKRHGATIFSNLTTPYQAGDGWTIAGPNSLIGEQFWIAEAFTPAANATVKEIDVAVGYTTGTNGVIVTLYTDNNGVPGTALWSKKLKNLPTYGTCCTVAVGKLKVGVNVTAGTNYFVAVTTGKKTSSMFGAWNWTNDNKDVIPAASNTGTGWGAIGGGLSPAGAFAVYD